MNIAIIAAGGSGKRMSARGGSAVGGGAKENKIFLKLLKRPVIYHTLKIFDNHQKINKVVISAQRKDIPRLKKIIKNSGFKKICCIVEAQNSRQDSIHAVIKILAECCKPVKSDLLVIHNAVNPLVTQQEINRVLSAAKTFGASLLAQPSIDTIKMGDKNNFVRATCDRRFIFRAQTPQVIRFDLAKKAYEKVEKDKVSATDDAMLVERLGHKVKIVSCSERNFKITYPKDLKLAEILMKEKNT
jgi:2-C-methyl-D-erythritol 4-phosphate cytidylyltransferase